MTGRYVMTLIAAGALTLAAAGSMGAYAQYEDCDALTADFQAVEQALDAAKHSEKEAFKKWDNYYQDLHSGTYAGTEEPLADTAEKCRSGGGGNYCERAMEEYDGISAKEQAAKKELDEARANLAKAEAYLKRAGEEATEKGCPLD